MMFFLWVFQHFAVGVFQSEHAVNPLGIDVVEVMGEIVAEFADGEAVRHGASRD